MPIELDDFPDIPRAPHVVRASKYDWPTWLSGRVYGLKEGEDFQIKLRVFRQQAANHARKHGYELQMKSDLVSRILYIRAQKAGEKKPRTEKPGPRKAPASSGRASTKRTETPRVAEPPKPVDPVSLVFGDRQETSPISNLPPRPTPVPGASFGDTAKREW